MFFWGGRSGTLRIVRILYAAFIFRACFKNSASSLNDLQAGYVVARCAGLGLAAMFVLGRFFFLFSGHLYSADSSGICTVTRTY